MEDSQIAGFLNTALFTVVFLLFDCNFMERFL